MESTEEVITPTGQARPPQDDPYKRRTGDEMTFSELLAHEVTTNKESYALALLNAFREGDPSAIKIVNQALLDSQYSEEDALPIDDQRFQEIICLIADAVRG